MLGSQVFFPLLLDTTYHPRWLVVALSRSQNSNWPNVLYVGSPLTGSALLEAIPSCSPFY